MIFTNLNKNKQASMLTADPVTWGQDVMAELITRLPKIQSFILEDRVVYHDQEGNGLVLVVLEFKNGRAFVPAVVKEWKLQPLDIIMYKQQKEVKYKYLSERNLIHIATFVGMGSAIGKNKFPGLNAMNVGVNVAAPAGGMGGRMGVPGGFGFGGGGKFASLDSEVQEMSEAFTKSASALVPTKAFVAYAQTFIKDNTDFWVNTKSASVVNPPILKPTSRYSLLVMNPDTDQAELFTDKSASALPLSDEQVGVLFSQAFPDPVARLEKTANFMKDKLSLLGSIYPREGNIFFKPHPGMKDTTEKSMEKEMPKREGIFLIDNDIAYVNPHVTYLDESPYNYGLRVQLGGCNLTKNIKGFLSTNLPDASRLTKEDLVPQVVPEKLARNQIITIFNGKTGTVSIPCKVLQISKTVQNTAIRVSPLFGDPSPVTLLFYRGTQRYQDPLNPAVYLVPFNETQLLLLPPLNKDLGIPPANASIDEHSTQVVITKGGGHLYNIQEGATYVQKRFSYGDLAFRLIRRYGFDEAQAAKMIKSLDTEKRRVFNIKYFLDELGDVATPNTELSDAQKTLAQKTASVAQGIFNLNKTVTGELVKSAHDLDLKMDYILTTKLGAADASNTANGGDTTSADARQPSSTTPPSSGRPGFMDMAAKQTPVAKDTQELLDLLTFYSLGKFRGDEATDILNKLENSLSEAEGYLCKVLLLTQLNRIPGHQYSDVKILLSDLDSYISSIVSSRVLLANNM